MSSLRAAATILVLRPFKSEKFDFQVLLVKRRKSARFFPNAMVFPGGVLEEADSKWKNISEQNFAKINLTEDKKLAPNFVDESAFRVAAIRELFEETGLLCCTKSKGKQQPHQVTEQQKELLSQWRAKVSKDAALFSSMLETLGLELDISSQQAPQPELSPLYGWAHWITPMVEKYRYNTLFFLTTVNYEQSLMAKEDADETTELVWVSPDKALSEFEREAFFLAPPTWFEINRIAQHSTLKSLLQYSSKLRFDGKSIPTIFPAFQPLAEDAKPQPIRKSHVWLTQTIFDGKAIKISGNNSDKSSKTWKYEMTDVEKNVNSPIPSSKL